MTRTLSNTISDTELADLRHRYRGDAGVTRIIECLEVTREELEEWESGEETEKLKTRIEPEILLVFATENPRFSLSNAGQ